MLVTCSVFAFFFLRSSVRSTLFPLYTSLNLGFSEEKIGLLLTVAAVVTSLCTFPSGWFSDKVGRKIPIMSSLLLSAIAVMLVPAMQSLNSLVMVMAFYGIATGLQGSLAAWPADVAPKDKLGTAMGVYRVVGDLGMVIGPITVTYIAEATGAINSVPFLVPAILAVFSAVLMLRAPDPARDRRQKITGPLP